MSDAANPGDDGDAVEDQAAPVSDDDQDVFGDADSTDVPLGDEDEWHEDDDESGYDLDVDDDGVDEAGGLPASADERDGDLESDLDVDGPEAGEDWDDEDWEDDDFPPMPLDAEVRIDLSAIDHEGHRSGFVTLVGRPNVGKSTLLNAICGEKVAITSDKPQTTRTQVRGVLSKPESQIVFVDTPGIHKPRTKLGERLNATATKVLSDVDVACLVIDATAPLGPGDKFVASRLPRNAVVVVNKCDIAQRDQIVEQLTRSGELEFSAYFPVSARTGDGVSELVDHLLSLMPEGPRYYPDEQIRDVPDPVWVAELVREQLLRITRDELPHSIATRVTEWDWPRVRVEILVERDSQKGIVIGHKGSVLKKVGEAARKQLPKGAFLELHVLVEKDWQRRPDMIERLGY